MERQEEALAYYWMLFECEAHIVSQDEREKGHERFLMDIHWPWQNHNKLQAVYPRRSRCLGYSMNQ